MQSIEQYEYRLPVWAICPLVNADNDGLTDNDIVQLKMFENELNGLVSELNANHYTIDYGNDDNEPYFSHTNDIDNLGGNVIDVTVHIFK